MTPHQPGAHLTVPSPVPSRSPRSGFQYLKREVNALAADLCRTLGATQLTMNLNDATGHAHQIKVTNPNKKPTENRQWRSYLFSFLPQFAEAYGFQRVQVAMVLPNLYNCKRCWPRSPADPRKEDAP